jgi:hypothetical protein
MKPTIRLFVLAATCAASLSALAADAPKLSPGLWEHGFTMKSRSGKLESAMSQMQKSMAALPPAQRQMMQDMMAKQGVALGDTGQSVKVCITPEQARADRMPTQEGCTQTASRSGNTWSMRFECKGNPPTSGHGQVTLESSKAYQGQFTVDTTLQGKPEQMLMNTRGKWLGDDCGNIRPASN